MQSKKWRTPKWLQLSTIVGVPIIVAIGIGAYVLLLAHPATNTPAQSTTAKSAPPTPATLKETATQSAQPNAPLPDVVPDYTIPPVTNGIAPVLSHLPTKQPVVFLGIDDGANKQQFEIDLMRQNNIKASLFLANRFIWNNYDFFKGFKDEGSLIENHSMNHPLMATMPFDAQKKEICAMADLEQKEYGRRPVLFRPPGGSYSVTTQRAAAACGMKAVVMWIAKANGGAMQYQIGHSLRPGDIVLMHFRPEFKQDLQAFLDAEHAANLHTVLLEDWLASGSNPHS